MLESFALLMSLPKSFKLFVLFSCFLFGSSQMYCRPYEEDLEILPRFDYTKMIDVHVALLIVEEAFWRHCLFLQRFGVSDIAIDVQSIDQAPICGQFLILKAIF